MLRRIAAGVGLVAVLALAGCAPAAVAPTSASTTPPTATATPTPAAQPALADLVLSPDGLGPLVIGAPVPHQPTASAVVLWNPTKCGTSGAWLPNYPDGAIGPGGDATGAPFYFAVESKTDKLASINVRSTQIKTAAEISIGSTLGQVKAAYPHVDAVVKGAITDLYEINGPTAKLVVEVERPGTDAAWDNKVVLMEVNSLGSGPGSLYGNDAGGGICPAP